MHARRLCAEYISCVLFFAFFGVKLRGKKRQNEALHISNVIQAAILPSIELPNGIAEIGIEALTVGEQYRM